MSDISAHKFPLVYEDLGIDLSLLGCIMLNVNTVPLSEAVQQVISGDDLYYANSPKAKYVDGDVTNLAHVTLLYGLMRTGPEMKKHVDRVLEYKYPSTVTIEDVDFFESNNPEFEYYAIIAHVKRTDEILNAHARLTFLPHIMTFPEYRPHVTLAYIRKDETLRDDYILALNGRLAGRELLAAGLNYGGNN